MTVATSYSPTTGKGSHRPLAFALLVLTAALATPERSAVGQEAAVEPAQVAPPDGPKEPPKLPPPEDAQPFPGSDHVWMNRDKKVVYVDGAVALREGLLEMFACPRGTKEHESVVAINSRAYLVHAALLAVGAEPGHPVDYRDDQYVPPAGDVINITVEWLDPQGEKHTAKAQEWVRDVKTKKAMPYDWVFAGSGFWKDEETGKQYYKAEGGELVCVANFSTAMLDVAAESTAANAGLLFEAFTENVPPLGTPVRLVMTPVKKDRDEKDDAEKPETAATEANPASGDL